MRSRYIAALDGVELSSIAPEIIVTDIAYGQPVRELQTRQLAGRDGQVLTRTITGGVSVTVYFEVHEQNVRRRMSIMEDVQRWAQRGGMLTTGDRPGRRLRVVCDSLPVIGSSLRWTGTCSLTLTAYASPFWEDELPTIVTISGNGSKTVNVPGFSAPAGYAVIIKNTGTSAISGAKITACDTFLQFTGISIPAGKALEISHDERDLLTATIDGASVLEKRTAASSDELVLDAGKSVALIATTDGTATTTVQIRGRYT